MGIPRATVAFAALALAAATGLSLPTAEAAGPNMLPNSSFEDGVNKQATSAPVLGSVDQPLLPTGWAFEGAAALFDHTPTKYHGPGRYSAAISVPLSGKRKVCYDAPVGCHDATPANLAKDTARAAYSVGPAWRPVDALPVAGGRPYVVSGWYTWTLASPTEGGAAVWVRWIDAVGAPIRTDLVYAHIAPPGPSSEFLNWTPFSVVATAPPNAAKAVPLYGAADDAFISNVAYDEVGFAPA